MNRDMHRQQRGTLVGGMLALIMTAGILSFMFILCGGYAIYAAIVVVGFAGLGSLHYFLWGRSLGNEVADERRAEEMRRRLEAEAWSAGDEDEPHDFRRF
jgi:hypothetical protein